MAQPRIMAVALTKQGERLRGGFIREPTPMPPLPWEEKDGR